MLTRLANKNCSSPILRCFAFNHLEQIMKNLNLRNRLAVRSIAAICAVGVSLGSASAETLKEKVASQGTLTIGLHGAWPYGITTNDGGVAGIFPEILKSLTASIGVKDVKFEVMEFGALIPSLMSHRIDVIAGGMYITDARCKQVAFSEPSAVLKETVR